MLPISREVLIKELETAKDYLDKWLQKVEAGIPGIDIPASGSAENHIEDFVREFCGEMRVVSGKCDTLSEVMSEALAQG
jgi:hypothetical protein